MANNIGWCNRTWNPITGCTPISEGCANCWAKRFSKRLAGRYGYPADDPFKPGIFHENRLEEVNHFGKEKKVFVCSMGDLFHDDVTDDSILQVFNAMVNSQWIYQNIFMVLTKRPARMKRIIELIKADLDEQRKPKQLPGGATQQMLVFKFPLRNIWLGVTAENQRTADERIPILLETPAAKHFVSVEPMLGPVTFRWAKWEPVSREHPTHHLSGLRKLDWVICGPETGPKARPCDKAWVANLYEQCREAGVPFWDKQDILGKNIKERPNG